MTAFKLDDTVVAKMEEFRQEVMALEEANEAKIAAEEDRLGEAIGDLLDKRAALLERDEDFWTQRIPDMFPVTGREERYLRAITSFRVSRKAAQGEAPASIRVTLTARPNHFFDAKTMHREINTADGKTISLSKIGWKPEILAKMEGPAGDRLSFFDLFHVDDIPDEAGQMFAENCWDSYSREDLGDEHYSDEEAEEDDE